METNITTHTFWLEVEDYDKAWLYPFERDGAEKCWVWAPEDETLETLCDEQKWEWLTNIGPDGDTNEYKVERKETFDYEAFEKSGDDGKWSVVPAPIWYEECEED